MVTRKDLIIAILATFCLASTLFMIMPLRSTSSNGAYDPWVDINGDGVIDSTDLGLLGSSWGTSGNPTKNVNVTNWPEWLRVGNVTVINWPSKIGVNVTNWPEDRTLNIKKGIEKTVVLDTFSGDWGGYSTGIQMNSQVQGSVPQTFYYLFEPDGQILNVTCMYINVIWRANSASEYAVWFAFYGGSSGNEYDYIVSWVDIPVRSRAQHFSVPEMKSNFNYTRAIDKGLNRLEINLISTDWLFLFKLEIFIEYYYLG